MMDDEPRPVKVHKVTLLIVDHDSLGPAEITRVLENSHYPNHCISPDVMAIETREVEWTDDHPLNMEGKDRAEFERLFAVTS